MLTVGIQGDATNRPSWTSVVRAIFTKSEAVIPVEAIYPTGTTTEQVNQQDSADMQASQQSAVAAALIQQGNDLPTELEVGTVQPGSAADGPIEKGDVITAFDGTSLDERRRHLAARTRREARHVDPGDRHHRARRCDEGRPGDPARRAGHRAPGRRRH